MSRWNGLLPGMLAIGLSITAAGAVAAATLTVGAPGSGADFTAVQAALDAAVAGDTVLVHEKPVPYFERLHFPRSGNPVDGPITLRAAPGERPVLDASTLRRDRPMIEIDSRSHVRVIGLELQNNRDGFGIEAYGSGTHIEIRDNHIHHMRGEEAGGIGFLGEKAEPFSDLVIDGNFIHDNEPAESETLVLNGNVSGFRITNNLLVDNDNIGIDLIGGERDVNPDPTLVARNGVVRGNVVVRSNASYDGGFGAGIYVDGGRDITIENNRVTGCDYGIEIAAENRGLVTSGIVVRNNVIHHNEKAGLVFGGFKKKVGRANGNVFTGNVLYHNNTLGKKGKGRYFDGNGIAELYVQFGRDNLVRNNLVVAGPENRMIAWDPKAGDENRIDHNLYWSADIGSARFSQGDRTWRGFAAWQAGSGHDGHGLAADPLLVDPANGDFHVLPGSPAIDAGDPAFAHAGDGERDLDGGSRLSGAAVDIGADEQGPRCPAGEGTGALCSRDRGAVAPGSLLVYYGFPSLINGAAGDLDAAAAELARHDFVVLGAGLERPAAEGGSDDHEETVAIVDRPALSGTLVFGYVPLGVLTGNLPQDEIEDRIDAWMDVVGADGIFFDEFGYDFCVDRARQNAAVGYVKTHHPGAPVVANAYQPDDALGDAVGPAFPNPACGAFTANPQRTPSRLDAGDAVLLESHQIALGAYEPEADWQARASSLRDYQESMGIQVWSVTTSAADDVYDPAKHAYAWYSAALYGHAATGWGEFAFGAIPSEAPFRAPPAVDPGAERMGPIEAEGSVYTVATDRGVLAVDAAARTGWFSPFDPAAGPCAADCAAFHGKVKLRAKPLVKAKERIDLFFEGATSGAFTGRWDHLEVAGTATVSGGKRLLSLDAASAAAVTAWLDQLAGPDVAIELRGTPRIKVVRKNDTQARLVVKLPFRATRGSRSGRGTARLALLGAFRD